MAAAILLVGLASGRALHAQVPLPPPLDPPEPSANARLLERLEQLEREVQSARDEREREVRELRDTVGRLQHELNQVRSGQSGSGESSGPKPWSEGGAQPKGARRRWGSTSGDGGEERDDGGGSGDEGDGYSGGAGSGAMSTGGGGGGGGGSVGRGSRVGQRSPAGYSLEAEYKYNFAGGFFQLSDEDKEFVLNVQNTLVADGTFYDRRTVPSRQQGFNIPFQRLYLYGNITDNWEYQVSEQATIGNFNLLDLLVNVHYDDRIMFKFGRFLTPFYYQDYATFPMLVPTINYSPLFQLSGQRQVGAMLWGKLAQNRVQYQAGVFNGLVNGFSDFDTNKDIIGSLTFTPFMASDDERFQNLGFGVSAQTGWQDYGLYRVEPALNIAGSGTPQLNSEWVTTSGVPFSKYNRDVRAWGNRTRIAPHFFWYGRFSVLAEYVTQSRKLADTNTQGISVQRGFYVQTSYFLTGERNTGDGTGGFPTIIPNRPFNPTKGEYGPGAWELATQFSSFDVGRGDIERGFIDPRWATRLDEIQLGMNWWPNKYTRISFNWVYVRFNQPVPWPIVDRGSDATGGQPVPLIPPRYNLIDDFSIFWTRVAFFF